jgi:hypothetical protein
VVLFVNMADAAASVNLGASLERPLRLPHICTTIGRILFETQAVLSV